MKVFYDSCFLPLFEYNNLSGDSRAGVYSRIKVYRLQYNMYKTERNRFATIPLGTEITSRNYVFHQTKSLSMYMHMHRYVAAAVYIYT